MTVDDLAITISQSGHIHKPILIGIEGFGGSGKTTLANNLKNRLGDAYVVSIDDFIVKEKLSEKSWDKGSFDRLRLEAQVLLPATSGMIARYQQLDWATNTLGKFVEVPNVQYLIIEGISCYHPDIAKYYDFKIWVDVPIELANKRGHARDGSNENANMWGLWAENDIRYKQKNHPELVADFVFDNTGER